MLQRQGINDTKQPEPTSTTGGRRGGGLPPANKPKPAASNAAPDWLSGGMNNARSRSEAPIKGSVGGATIDSQEGKDSHPSAIGGRDRTNPNRAIFLSNADN